MIKRKPAWLVTILTVLLISMNFKVDSFPIVTDGDYYDLKNSISFTETANVANVDDVPNDVMIENTKNSGLLQNSTANETTIQFSTVLNVEQFDTPTLRSIRDGQVVTHYSIEIIPNGDNFEGRATIGVQLAHDFGEVRFHAEGLDIHSIIYGFTDLNSPLDLNDDDYNVDDGVLEIFPEHEDSSYIFLITYEGQIRNDGRGLYRGVYEDNSYLAMNLLPTNARRVFPCMDEATAASPLTVIFHNEEYNTVIGNSINEATADGIEFSPMMTPPHLWNLVAHNFINLINPGERIRMHGRLGVSGQDSYASIITQNLITFLNEYTAKPHFEIDASQEQNLHIFAMPDLTHTWHSPSTVAIWEPYLLMENMYSAKQQKIALMTMAESYAGVWFGYAVYPQNWRYAWVTEALSKYAGYEAAAEADARMDMVEIFVADVIQEGLLRDGYASAHPLQPEDDLDDELMIRDNINGLMKYKAPALMHMLKLVLGQNRDYIQAAASGLANARNLGQITSQNLIGAIRNNWLSDPDKIIEDVGEYLEPWMLTNGYPILHVQFRSNSLLLQQERFGFTARDVVNYNVPITYTTSLDPDFESIYPFEMMDNLNVLTLFLPEEEWVLFNIQGQGYYRVNYDDELWERIIEALDDPERREVIHPLNRATLVDDALNLARAGRLEYDIAFRVVLTMYHETNYAVWKAFVRNMDFLRKRLVAYVTIEEDLDPDIYLRMVRRTIGAVENELTFYPEWLVQEDSTVAMTRGLVMDHACRARYAPCIAAAVDWFYDPNNAEPVVNPNIPHDIRPAVYCTMVREGDEQATEALWARYEIEPTHYERVVILESLGCSSDQEFILGLLQETLDENGRFPKRERSKFMISVIESSFENAELALNFMRGNTNAIRDAYGGNEILEEILFVFAENMAEFGPADAFNTWIHLQNNNLDDNQPIAERAAAQAMENLQWDDMLREAVYEWIDENDAAGVTVTVALLIIPLLVGVFNQ